MDADCTLDENGTFLVLDRLCNCWLTRLKVRFFILRVSRLLFNSRKQLLRQVLVNDLIMSNEHFLHIVFTVFLLAVLLNHHRCTLLLAQHGVLVSVFVYRLILACLPRFPEAVHFFGPILGVGASQ